MKKFLSILIITLVPIAVYSQNTNQKKTKEKMVTQTTGANYSLSEKMYRQAITYGDYEVARAALYYMMAEQPDNYHLKDSLAKIYLGQGYYHLSNKMAGEVLLIEPENQDIMEVKAISLQAIGQLKESAQLYEKLFNNGVSLQHGYQLAVIQYNMQRFGECKTTSDKVIAMENSKTETIYLSYGDQGGQEVSLKAACHNLKGVMHKDLKQFITARIEFEAAILAAPGFELAKKNLESLPPDKDIEGK